MAFSHSLPVPEFWECVFSIPFPFPNFGNGIIHSRSRSRTPKSHSRSLLQRSSSLQWGNLYLIKSWLFICVHEKYSRGINSSLILQKITILCIWLWNYSFVSWNSKIRRTSGAEEVVWAMSIALSPWRAGRPISYHHQFAAEFADAKLRLLQFDVSIFFW